MLLRDPSFDLESMDDFLAELFLLGGDDGGAELGFEDAPLLESPACTLDSEAYGNAPTSTTSRKRSAEALASADESEGVSVENSSKRQQRLQRNRMSASLSRERKKHMMKSLEQRVRELERANSHLSFALATKNVEVQRLSAEVAQLRAQDGVPSANTLTSFPQPGSSSTSLPSSALGQKGVTESAVGIDVTPFDPSRVLPVVPLPPLRPAPRARV